MVLGHDELRIVDREEFCRLAISNRRMQRADDPHRDIRGLIDVDTGVRYVIDEEILFDLDLSAYRCQA